MARPTETTDATLRVLAELERRELLLQAGREFASVANMWWAGHTTGAMPGVKAARSRLEMLVGGDAQRLPPRRWRLSGRASK
jgi:hypothetical protein